MNALDGDQLRLVFQLCQPNAANLISLHQLQSLLDQHANANLKGNQDHQVIRHLLGKLNKIVWVQNHRPEG